MQDPPTEARQAVWEILTEPESGVEELVRETKEAQKEKRHGSAARR